MRMPKHTVLPAILLGFLCVMTLLGYDSYRRGLTSPMLYFGGIVLTLCCITALYLHLRRGKK